MKKFFALCLLLVASLPLVAQAQLYGVSLNGYEDGPTTEGPSSLYSIDPATGAGTLIGDIGYAVNSLAIDPTTGILYGAQVQWGSTGYLGNLLTIDPATGAGTIVGGFGSELYCCRALTFDSSGQLWGWTEWSDDPVRIDKATGAATTVGNSGIGTGGQVMAFDSSDVLWLVQGSLVYHINQATGAAMSQFNLGFDPGSGGADFDPNSGLLWAAGTNGQTLDSKIRITDLAAKTYTDLDTDVEYLHALTFGDISPPVARFKVTKTFSDGSNDEVDVTLTCTTGLPLKQTTTIAGGDPVGVTFVVTDIAGGIDCEVTESGGPANYTPVFNGGAGCSWTGAVASLNVCEITNNADDATFTANMMWYIENDGGDEVNTVVPVTIGCDSEITTAGAVQSGSYWYLSANLDDGQSLSVDVSTGTGPANCWATQNITQTGVESVDDCGSRALTAGSSDSCTFENTVFFEGIPTLSQYGLAILALLTLGVGLVGFRRFV